MKVLLDHCVPKPFERLLPGHQVWHTSTLKWGHLGNGQLLDAAEVEGFEVMITVDSNIRFQQNMAGRKLSLMCLKSSKNDIPTLMPMAELVMEGLKHVGLGEIVVVENPDGA